jgi:Protein of unknown function (DUF2950)
MRTGRPLTLFVRCRLGAAVVFLTVAAGCGDRQMESSAGSVDVAPQQFASPEEAAGALVAAAEKFDVPSLKTILGTDGLPLVASADSVRDRNDATAFAAQARTKQHLELDSTKSTATLSVGQADWPLPIPIVKRDGKWSFDAAAGRDEVLRRRIGRNELDAIEICRGYVEAQRAYALEKHDGARVNQYAQRVISTPGKHDGLAWQDPDGTWHGPVAEAAARFIAEGYKPGMPPYHGYHFKILKGQGPAAPLGQMDFMVEGAMIGGFAMVAAPAEYLVTGVKTFIVSHDGVVYEKDLGEKTLDQFRTLERYNPDSTWKPVIDQLSSTLVPRHSLVRS